nr:MAG TPA: hypothetical protein [Bacteriophage sp.]
MYKFEVGKVYKSYDDDNYLYRYEGLCKDYEGNMAYQFDLIKNDKYREPIYGVYLRFDHIDMCMYDSILSEGVIIVETGVMIFAMHTVED